MIISGVRSRPYQGGTVHPFPGNPQFGFHLLDLLLNIVSLEHVFAREDMTVAKGLAIAMEVEPLLSLDNNFFVVQVLDRDDLPSQDSPYSCLPFQRKF
jgi:hypothetical protein